MKNNFRVLIKIMFLMLFVAIPAATMVYAQKDNKINIYVWDFKANAEDLMKYAERFTDDFETELIKMDKYAVLQRRNHNLVLVHREMENAISSIKNLPDDAVDKLKNIKAEIVVFGELIEDVDSGVYEVSVFFQNLNNGEIPKKESVIIEKALIASNSDRKKYMKKLIDKLHAEEVLLARTNQLGLISKKLDTYIVKVKDVQIAYRDIIEVALKKEVYFKELEAVISAYNEIFIDLNDNGEQYILDFESVWGKEHGNTLETVYKHIMEDIHKKHILKLNDVRKKIWAYRESQSNKKERERLKEEIIWESKNASIGLNTAIDTVEDEVENLYLNLKKEMRSE